jgi:serine/threonine-protein kinase RsbW
VDRAETDDTIRLSVPARLEYLRIVRLTTSGVASRLGFDVDEIENLRVAIDDLTSMVVESAAPGTLDLSFCVRGNELHIEGNAPVAPGVDATIDELTEQILKAVTDDYGFRVADGIISFTCARQLPSA